MQGRRNPLPGRHEVAGNYRQLLQQRAAQRRAVPAADPALAAECQLIAGALDGWLQAWNVNNLAANWQQAAADLTQRLTAAGMNAVPGTPARQQAQFPRLAARCPMWLQDVLTVIQDLQVFGPQAGFRPDQTVLTVTRWCNTFNRGPQ